MKIKNGVLKPSIAAIKSKMFKPSKDLNIIKIKDGIYRVYMSHRDASVSVASLSLHFNISAVEVKGMACYEVKAKEPMYRIIEWSNKDVESIKKAEKQKMKFENVGFEKISESVDSITGICTITYKTKN